MRAPTAALPALLRQLAEAVPGDGAAKDGFDRDLVCPRHLGAFLSTVLAPAHGAARATAGRRERCRSRTGSAARPGAHARRHRRGRARPRRAAGLDSDYLRLWPHARFAIHRTRTGHLGFITRPDEFARSSRTVSREHRAHTIRGDASLADVVREIPGPVGPLEALDIPPGRSAPRAAVVFAHPLPIKGGTMHTKVVFQAAKALTRIGCVVLRFNFRGVGRSAGTWDNGQGEMDDYRAPLDYAAAVSRLELWAAGFSFGSYIAMTAGRRRSRVCALIGIAPPVDRYDFASVKQSTKPKFIVHGERDELIR